MMERERIGYLEQVRRFFVHLNLFETDDTDERTIHVQQWSTRVYICVLLLCMCILSVQYCLHVETRLIEVKDPSLESYLNLQNLYTDVNCPCSQISVSYGSFVMLSPIYYPICSSEFISQTWIEMLVDNLTNFRFPGDFRATGSTQFQALRELCSFSQSALDNVIQSFYASEFISGTLLSENSWRIEIGAIIDALLNSSFTDITHKISFIRSFIIYNFFVSAIQTPISLLIENEYGAMVIDPVSNYYQVSLNSLFCACDDGGICSFPSSFYTASMAENSGYIAYWILPFQLSLTLKNWFTGCWALESLFLSSFNNSFLYNQTELNLIAHYFNWSSNMTVPTALNLEKSIMINESSGTLDDLVQTSFVESMMTELNYSVYFEQCRAEFCYYSSKQRSDFLHIVTSLLTLYGGLSIAFRFLTPRFVAFLFKWWRRLFGASINDSEFELQPF